MTLLLWGAVIGVGLSVIVLIGADLLDRRADRVRRNLMYRRGAAYLKSLRGNNADCHG